jgi:type I restriction enzyme S subunit
VTQAAKRGRTIWPTVELSEVADHCLGKMLDAKKNKGRLLPYLANPNVRWFDVDTSKLKLMAFEDHEDERYGLQRGDVVICEGGEAGRAAVWDGRVAGMRFQKAIHRVRTRENLDARFLVHQLLFDHQSGRLAEYYTGATIKHLTGQDLARYRFPLPPLSEQRRIAAILDQAAAVRAKRQMALAKLTTLKQAIFLEMFGDPVSNLRGWSTLPLVEACYCYSGGTPSKSNSDSWTGDVPWFSAKDLKQDDLFDSIDHISRDVPRTTSLRLLPADTVAIVVRGMILAHTFPVSVLRAPATINQDLKALLPRVELRPQFLAACLRAQSAAILERVSEAGHGTKRLDVEGLAGIQVLYPSIALQDEFEARILSLEHLQLASNAAKEKLNRLFSSLQHRAFQAEL